MFVRFAKILDWNGRQVLLWLARDDQDVLCLYLQLWVERTQEQLQGKIYFADEDPRMIDMIDQDNLATVLEELGLIALLEEIENEDA